MKTGNRIGVSSLFLILFGSLSVLFSGGCNEDASVPSAMTLSEDSIIPEPAMILMLADVHMIEAAMLIRRNRGFSQKDTSGWYYQELFRKYGVTENQYRQSLRFYQKDPKYFAEMYQQVIDLLARKEKDFLKK